MDLIKHLIHNYLVLFGMVNAVGNLPIFADLTQGMEASTRTRTFRVAVLTAGSIVMIFALFGHWMLKNVFEVDTAAFKIAGGLLVFAVAARGVLLGSRQKTNSGRGYENVAVFPMAFPFLAGPGTIVTTILLFQSEGSLITAATALLVYATVVPILHLAPIVERTIGRIGVLIVTRILYIFICAKAVSFVIEGLRMTFFSQPQ